MIFQVGPVPERGHQGIVPDILDLLRLIPVLSGFRFPVAAGPVVTVLLREFHAPVDIGEWLFRGFLHAGPENGKPHNFPDRFRRGQGFPENLPALRAVHE